MNALPRAVPNFGTPSAAPLAGVREPGTAARAIAKVAPSLKIARDPFRRCLFVLVVLAVSRIHMQFPALKAMRPALVVTIAAVALAWLKPGSLSKRPLLATWPAKAMAGFCVVVLLSTAFGISFGNSAKTILDSYSKTIALAVLIIISIRSARDLYLLVWAYVVSALLLGYTSLFVFQLQNYHGYQRLANLDTYDANDCGLVMLVGLPLSLLALQMAKPIGKVVAMVTLVAIGATIAKTGSRGAFVGLIAVGIGLLILLERVAIWKRVMFVVVTVGAMIAFAPPGYWKQMQTIQDPKADYNWNTVNGRRKVALRGIGYMMDYPLFGIGINNFAKAECLISDKAKSVGVGEGIRCTPPHNSYIEAGAETGIPGGLLWIISMPGGVVALLMLRHRLPKRWAWGDREEQFLYQSTQYFAVMMAGYAVGSFFLTFAWVDVTYYIFAIVAGLYVCVEEKRTRGDDPRQRR